MVRVQFLSFFTAPTLDSKMLYTVHSPTLKYMFEIKIIALFKAYQKICECSGSFSSSKPEMLFLITSSKNTYMQTSNLKLIQFKQGLWVRVITYLKNISNSPD